MFSGIWPAVLGKGSGDEMIFQGRSAEVFHRFWWLAAAAALAAACGLAVFFRGAGLPSQFVLCSYLQIAGTLLAFSFTVNALLRIHGGQDRLTLILAFALGFTGFVETSTAFGFYAQIPGSVAPAHVLMAWTFGRALLAVLLLAALVAGNRSAHFRGARNEMGVAFVIVAAIAYLGGAVYLNAPFGLTIHSSRFLARPWELLPASLFLAAAIGFTRRLRSAHSIFDKALALAAWLNVACHLAATQSTGLFDIPFAVAQLLKVGSYAVLLGSTLIENARLFEQARWLAVRDCLTGLGNYRTLLNALEGEMQRSRRTGRPFTVLLMDLDGLKAVNDRHGHLVGTRAICRLGDVLRLHCRAMDTAARYGGDEFALILPEADRQAAEIVGKRICDRLASDGQAPAITVSVGAAVFPDDGQSVEALLGAADRALYRMKGVGSPVLSLARIAACI